MKESERDISRALAAFGAPRLKYHSFSRPPISNPEPPVAPVVEPPVAVVPPAPPPPFKPVQETVAMAPALPPTPPLMPPAASPAEFVDVGNFSQGFSPTPDLEPAPAHLPTPESYETYEITPPQEFVAQAHVYPVQPARRDDTAMSDIFNFLSMKPPSQG